MYELLILKQAEKGFIKLSKEIARRIIPKILELRENSKPIGCRKVIG